MKNIETLVLEAAQKDSMKYLKVAAVQPMHGNHFALYNESGEYVGQATFVDGEIIAFYAA